MARQLAKYGADALKPLFREGVWHKPRISARVAADLKKQYRLEGREWPIPEEAKRPTKYGFGLKRRPKGHKHDKLREERQEGILANLKAMPKRIAEYRESRKLRDDSLIDRVLLTPKERRMKQFRLPK